MSKKQVISVVGNYTVVPKDELSGIVYAMNATISDIQSVLKELYLNEVRIIRNPFEIGNSKLSPFIEFRMVNRKADKSFALELDARGNIFYVFSYGKIKIAKVADSNLNFSDAVLKLVKYNFNKDGNYYFARNDFQGKLFPLPTNATNIHESDGLDAARAEGLGYLLNAAKYQTFDVLPNEGLILPLNIEEAKYLHYHVGIKNNTSNSTLPYVIAAAATGAGLYAIHKLWPGGGDAPALVVQSGLAVDPDQDQGNQGGGGNDGQGGGGQGGDDGSNGSGGGSQASRKFSRIQGEVDLKNIIGTPRRNHGNENREEQELESTEVSVATEDQREGSNLEFGEIYDNRDEHVASADQVLGRADVRDQRAESVDSMPYLGEVYGGSDHEDAQNPMFSDIESDIDSANESDADDSQEESIASEEAYLKLVDSVDLGDLRDQNPAENLRDEVRAEVSGNYPSDEEATSPDNLQHNASNIPALVTAVTGGGDDDGDAGGGANNVRGANNQVSASNAISSAQAQDDDSNGDDSSDGGDRAYLRHSDPTHNLDAASGGGVVDSSDNSMDVSGHSILGVNIKSHTAGKELKLANLQEEPKERTWNEWIANKAIPAVIGAAAMAGGALVYRMSVAGKNVDNSRSLIHEEVKNGQSNHHSELSDASLLITRSEGDGIARPASAASSSRTDQVPCNLRSNNELPDVLVQNAFVSPFRPTNSYKMLTPTNVRNEANSLSNTDQEEMVPASGAVLDVAHGSNSDAHSNKRGRGNNGNIMPSYPDDSSDSADLARKSPHVRGVAMDVVEHLEESDEDASMDIDENASKVSQANGVNDNQSMDVVEHLEESDEDASMDIDENASMVSQANGVNDNQSMDVVERTGIASTRRVVEFAENLVSSPAGNGNINDLAEDRSSIGSPAHDNMVRRDLFATPAPSDAAAPSAAAASGVSKIAQTPGTSQKTFLRVKKKLDNANPSKIIEDAVAKFVPKKLKEGYDNTQLEVLNASFIELEQKIKDELKASCYTTQNKKGISTILENIFHSDDILSNEYELSDINNFGYYYCEYNKLGSNKEVVLTEIAQKFKMDVGDVQEILTSHNPKAKINTSKPSATLINEINQAYVKYLTFAFVAALRFYAAKAQEIETSDVVNDFDSDYECALDTYQSILEDSFKEAQEEICMLEDKPQELQEEGFAKSQEEVGFIHEPTLAELIAGNLGLYVETAAHSLATVGLSVVAPNYFKSAAVYAYSKIASDIGLESQVSAEGRSWSEWATVLPEQIVNSISTIEPKDFAKYSFDSWVSFEAVKPITEFGFFGLSAAVSLISDMVLPKHVSQTQMVPFLNNAKFVYLGGAYAGSVMVEASKAVVSFIAANLIMPSVAKASDNMLEFFAYKISEVSFSLSEAVSNLYVEVAEKYDHAKDYLANVFEIRVEDASNCYVFKTPNSTSAEYQSDNYDAPIGETLFHSYSA